MVTGFIVIFMTVLEIVFLSFLARTYRSYTRIKQNGLRAQGEITDYEIKQGNKGQKTYFPIIKFQTLLGQEIHQKSLFGIGESKYVDKGSKIEVIYLENEPTRFMVDFIIPSKLFQLFL